MPQIRIDSVIGGIMEDYSNSRSDEFSDSYAVNFDRYTGFGEPSLLFPEELRKLGNTNGAPLWIVSDPKDSIVYVYDAVGSIFTITGSSATFAGLGDLNDGGSSHGNGSEYYDNYIYFARDTTVARYGPLDGTPAFADDYWVGTLGKTALTNTTYPSGMNSLYNLPNHVMHRHSDGRLYFADVVGNQGYLHYISTTKTTVEGDTDNGSTYQKLQFPYGYYPIDIESYGDQLAIALIEGTSVGSGLIQKPAKIAFWDTTSGSFNKIVDFPDPLISALQFDPVTNVLYVFSGNITSYQFRISRFVGGYAFQQIKEVVGGVLPIAGAVDNGLNTLIFGGQNINYGQGSYWTLGTSLTGSKKPLFNSRGCSGGSTSQVTCVKIFNTFRLNYVPPYTGWVKNGGTAGIDYIGNGSIALDSYITSKIFNIGERFKIKSVKFNLDGSLGATGTITPSIIIDNNKKTVTGQSINSTTYGSKTRIVWRPQNASGEGYFVFKITWSGIDDGMASIILPIIIDWEPIND